ncbi:protein obstructor-E-like [Rhagoletis pomonella]|uniref:protein obstructor-E-like n=1 Tax=Rhagoletis pomonella TaxID=28610 RepID=UPI00178202ED|nr:protein obstructor-E-like [Rhagoletis pomonella]
MDMKFLLYTFVACTTFGKLLADLAPVNICSGVADKIFLPYLGDCTKYYICMSGQPIERECEYGYHFDSKEQSCTYPDVAKCLPTCSNALSSFCYDRTCTKYVLCYAGTPILRECSDGLQYNAETDRCDFPQYVDCVDNMCTIFNDPGNITFLTSKASCDKYFICMDGYAYAQNCSKGLLFNTACNCCDFAERVNCTITAATRNIIPYSKMPPRRADIECPAVGASFIAHRDLAKYYYCLNGMGVVLECTPGLVYDAKLETCRTPENVARSPGKAVVA